jgi:hypothetical protein
MGEYPAASGVSFPTRKQYGGQKWTFRKVTLAARPERWGAAGVVSGIVFCPHPPVPGCNEAEPDRHTNCYDLAMPPTARRAKRALLIDRVEQPSET